MAGAWPVPARWALAREGCGGAVASPPGERGSCDVHGGGDRLAGGRVAGQPRVPVCQRRVDWVPPGAAGPAGVPAGDAAAAGGRRSGYGRGSSLVRVQIPTFLLRRVGRPGAGVNDTNVLVLGIRHSHRLPVGMSTVSHKRLGNGSVHGSYTWICAPTSSVLRRRGVPECSSQQCQSPRCLNEFIPINIFCLQSSGNSSGIHHKFVPYSTRSCVVTRSGRFCFGK